MRKVTLALAALLASSSAYANTITATCVPASGDVVTSCKLYKPLGATANPATDQLLDTNTTCTFARPGVWNGTFRHYCVTTNSLGDSPPSNIASDTVGPQPTKPRAPALTTTNTAP